MPAILGLLQADQKLTEYPTMRNATFLMLAFLATFLGGPSALSQSPQCPHLAALPGPMGYQQRSGSIQCEGLYESPVAGESLEFLSFSTGSIGYDLAIDRVLIIAAPDIGQLAASEVKVRARELQLNSSLYYRMDTSVASAKDIEWPLDVVIRPQGFSADSIGLIGWIDKDGAKTWIPLSVFPKGKPLAPTNNLVAVFRSAVDIQKVQWRLWEDGAAPQSLSWQVLGGATPKTFRAGDPIRLSLPRSSRVLNLEIVAKMINSNDWLTFRERVYLP